ncbi:MAG: hypothetical protein HY318_19140 [Armatimonadetes bacterium]|nr:hypothetical protein [Armatimonadota bacterium]
MVSGFLTDFTEDEWAPAKRIGYTSLEVHISSLSAEVFTTRPKMQKAAE